MKNPLALFTGAALAALAALAGLNLTDWPAGAPDSQKPAEAAQNKAPEDANKAPEQANQAPEQTPATPSEQAAQAPEKPVEMAAIPAPEPPKAEAQAKPELDTVRVESDGQAIVAGRAQPGAEVALKLGGQVIGKGVASPDGSWVVVPDQPLPKGAHEITIEQKAGDAPPVTGAQSIAVAVPEKAGEQAMVALTEPGTATKVLQTGGNQQQASVSETPTQPQTSTQPQAEQPKAPETTAKPAEPTPSVEPSAPETTVAKTEVPDAVAPPAQTPQAETAPAKPAENVALQLDAVDYNDAGDIIFSGRAKPGTAVRLYVDNHPVGDAIVDGNGNWSFAGKDIIAPGTHDLRADQIDSAGKVIARIELPFLRENAEAVAALNKPSASETAKTEQPPAMSAAQPSQPSQPATEEAPQKTAEAPPATTAEPQQQATAEPPAQTGAAPTTTTAEATPSQGASVPKSEPQASTAAPEQPATAGQTQNTVTAASEEAAKAVEPDQARSGKVVIQPGNNLWKLSRVIYGRGKNYTVIYQANKDQIRNPARIYPGQIFAIPGAMPPEKIDPKRKEPLTSAEGGAVQ